MSSRARPRFTRDVDEDEAALEGRLSIQQAIALIQEAWRDLILPTSHTMLRARPG